MYADSISVRDIYEAGQAAINYAKGLTKEEILADQMRLQAIKYQLIVIGEAAVRLSDSFRNNHPKITWREMIGMRNILVPQYHWVELDIIWGVVQNSVPALISKIEPLISAD